MNWKLCAKFILITSVVLSSAAVWAQGQSNITCINQFYHNWGAAVGDVAVQGDYVYLACQEEGLRIVDITDYNSPIDVAHLPITRADVVTVAGNYAYVGSWVNGVQVIDISNPASPQEVHSVPVDRGVNAIRIEGNHAFICSPSSGLIIMNIANPSTAYVVWNSTDLPGMQDIDIHGSIAYAVTNNDGMFVLDISDLSSPQILDTFQVDDYNYITGCSISDGYAYLSCGWSGLRVVNLSTMEAVAQIDSLYYAYAVKVQNGFAYVHYGDFDCPIAIVDIANPSSPQTLGIYYPPQDLLKFTMKGNLIYVADAQHGLRIVDVSDPRDPIEIAHYSRYGRDVDVTVSDNIAYVREDMKLKMIDISNMQHPIELGYFEMNWDYGDAEIAGNVAYLVTHGYTCLYAVDISNPRSPNLLGTFTVTDSDIHYQVAIYDHYAYLVENDGLRILDIADASNITQVGYYHYDHLGNGAIEIYDHYAFVGTGYYQSELLLLDLTDPITPMQIASSDINGSASDLKVVDGVLYAAIRHSFFIFELPASSQWAPVGEVNLYEQFNSRPHAIAVYGHYAYVTGETYGLCVFDVADRTAPELTGYYETPGMAQGVAAIGDIAVVADWSNLGFYNCSQALPTDDISTSAIPQTAALLQNYPNPFNASTQIPLELPMRSHVTLKVYDVLGRHVTTLVDGDLTAGRHMLHWNGTAANGQALASGKYFVRAAIDGNLETMPILYLK